MSEQKQAEVHKRADDEDVPAEAKDLRNRNLAADIDDLLDEIDGVLEENAEEFVNRYVQKGGQ